MESNISKENYKKLEERVKRIKRFYNHLQVFVIVITLLLFFSDAIIAFFEARISNANLINWIKVNFWVNPIIWGVVVLFHGIYAYKSKVNFLGARGNKNGSELINNK
jgi:hypothetical protein